MKLATWSPFDIEMEWDSLFHLPRFLTEEREFPFRPVMDVTKKDGDLIVTAELPGIDPTKDVEITMDDDFLTIKGEKSEEKEVSEEDRYTHERRYGSFMRRIPVPDGASADKISATYDKGVLTVKVTLPEEKKHVERRNIPVEVATL